MMNQATSAPSQTLLEWQAPIRAHSHSNKEVLRFTLAVATLLSALAWLFADKILILPIVSVVFVFYVLTITPAPETTNQITKFGITSGGQTIKFDSISSFYFIKKYDFDILVLMLHDYMSQRAYILLTKPASIENVKLALIERVVYLENPPHTISDNMANWLTTLIPSPDSKN